MKNHPWPRVLNRAVLIAGLLFTLPGVVVPATLIPQPLRATGEWQWHPVGNGELRWLGFKIYDAALWTAEYSAGSEIFDAPLMLSIEYRRHIPTTRLIETTDEQWRRLDRVGADRRKAWLERLEQIWPDVKPGDLIACLVHPGEETRFYNRSALLGIVEDADFGPEFLAIWLDPRTEFPALRTQLLGKSANGITM